MSKSTETTTTEVMTLNNREFDAFKNAYNKVGKSMLECAKKAYKLCEKNKKEFIARCKEELPELSKGTISKLCMAGKIASESTIELPDSYTTVYALAPVREQLEEFNEKLIEDGLHLPEMSQRAIEDKVDEYLYIEEPTSKADPDEEVDEDEIDDEESFRAETSDDEDEDPVIFNLESVANAIEFLAIHINDYTKKEIEQELKDFAEDLLNITNSMKGGI